MKILLLLFVCMLIFSSVSALVANVTEFDDGSSEQNITSNTTKYITLPINSTILQANITFRGLNTQDKYLGINTTTLEYQCSNNVTSCSYTDDDNWSTYTQFNNSLGINILYQNFTVLNGSKYATIIYWDSGVSFGIGLPYFCISPYYKNSSGDWESMSLTSGNCNGEGSEKQARIRENIENFTILEFTWLGKSGNVGSLKFYESNVSYYDDNYPKNVLTKVNNTIVFNNTGNLTGTNASINLNLGNVMQNCFVNNPTCQIDLSATNFGGINWNSLYVQYNKSNSATLNIISPTQITASVTSGDSYTLQVALSNSGDWNATNIDFYTVSAGGTPNYNGLISHDCTSLENGSSVVCNVTFNSLTQNPEPDEKLKVNATGTDSGQTVYSNSIDVDITVTAAPSPPTGGGGGGVVVDNTNRSAIINWGILQWEYSIPFAPYKIKDNFLIKNIGNKDFDGILTISNNLNKYLHVAVCDEDFNSCRTTNIQIKSGQSKIVSINGTIDSFPEFEEGFFRLESNNALDGIFELKARLSRFPAYKLQKAFINGGFDERVSLILTFATVVSGLAFIYLLIQQGGLG